MKCECIHMAHSWASWLCFSVYSVCSVPLLQRDYLCHLAVTLASANSTRVPSSAGSQQRKQGRGSYVPSPHRTQDYFKTKQGLCRAFTEDFCRAAATARSHSQRSSDTKPSLEQQPGPVGAPVPTVSGPVQRYQCSRVLRPLGRVR